MKTPQIPPNRNTAPRCPLCGILLDIDVDIDTRAADKMAVVTLMPLSRTHVLKPHTMDFPEEQT